MIWDCMLFNNEVDLLKLHLSVMDEVADHFVIVEGRYTFSGKFKKESAFYDNLSAWEPWLKKITHVWDSYLPSANRWENEHRQRNAIHPTLRDAQLDDTILICDVDEIPDPDVLRQHMGMRRVWSFDTYAYYYFMDYMMWPQDPTTCRSIVVTPYSMMDSPQKTRELRLGVESFKGGSHFSYLGGIPAIQEKISSFSHAEYDADYYKDVEHLRSAIVEGRDLFDRKGINFRRVPVQYPSHPKFLVAHQGDYEQFMSSRLGEYGLP